MTTPAHIEDPKSPTDIEGHPKIQCKLCGNWYHRLDVHLSTKHKTSILAYLEDHPGAPTISDKAKKAASVSAKGAKPVSPEKHVAATTAAKPVEKKPESPLPDDVKRLKFGAVILQTRSEKEIPPAEAVFVPAHDNDWQVGARTREHWEFMALGLSARENILFVGPTGCGKSATVMEMASVLRQPVRRVNLHGDVRAADFVGEKVVDVDEATGQAVVKWTDGILPQAMRKGHWLLLDELDAAPPAILFVLQSVLEGKPLVLTANAGEVVTPHPEFRVIATANTLGHGDDTGLYAGTNVLNEAFLDRFAVVIETDYPDAASEIAIVVKKGSMGEAKIDEATAKSMVSVATKVREGFANDTCHCTFSTRRLIAWAQKTAVLSSGLKIPMAEAARKAATITVTNKLSKEDRAFVGDLVQRHFGGKPTV